MTDAFTSSPTLTAEQRAVVEQPWNARVLVTAGPGAGKTHTLVRRLEALLQDEEAELEAGEVLVLSFSRAAVQALRARIDAQLGSARFVRVQTFDSWASTLLRDLGMESQLDGTSFDERIRLATDAVLAGGLDRRETPTPAHVLIDEVQDLVGARRELVQAVIEKCEEVAGFTVVGDLAQSVYGFTIDDADRRADEVGRFFTWLRERYTDDLVEFALTANFRAEDAEAELALPLGPTLRALPDEEDASALYDSLRRLLEERPDFGDFDDDFVLPALQTQDSTAILCDTHDQVMYFSAQLHAAGIPHRVQRSPLSRQTPAWMADVLRATDADTVDHERYNMLLEGLEAPERAIAEGAWRAFRRIAAGSTGRDLLDLRRLRRAVADGTLPDEVTAQQPHSLTISTIRRAKGLEFDRVLIVEPKSAIELDKRSEAADIAEAARLLFVAMTRSRYGLYRVGRPELWTWRKSDKAGRWYLTGRNPKAKWQRAGIELVDRDVDHETPPGTGELRADAVAIQQRLQDGISPDADVTLRLLHELPLADDESPPYGIYLGEQPIGEVSSTFRCALFTVLEAWRGYQISRWPLGVAGFSCDGVETVVGTEAATTHAGLGQSGVWLAPRLSGMGRFDWNGEGTQ